MKILFDHNLDQRLRLSFRRFETATAQGEGWSDRRNGELLALAEESGFDVLLTADSNIKDQQNLSGRKIAVLILRAFNNRLVTHIEMAEQISSSLGSIEPGQIVEVFHPDMALKRLTKD